MTVAVLDMAQVGGRVKRALDYLESTFSEPCYVSEGSGKVARSLEYLETALSGQRYESESPNHADDISEADFTNSLNALIGPFAEMLERCENADRRS